MADEEVPQELRSEIFGALLGDPVFVLALLVRRGLADVDCDLSLDHFIGGPTNAEGDIGGHPYRITVERLDGPGTQPKES